MTKQNSLLHKIKEGLSYEIRGAKFIKAYQPGYFPSGLLKTLLSSIYPFV